MRGRPWTTQGPEQMVWCWGWQDSQGADAGTGLAIEPGELHLDRCLVRFFMCLRASARSPVLFSLCRYVAIHHSQMRMSRQCSQLLADGK